MPEAEQEPDIEGLPQTRYDWYRPFYADFVTDPEHVRSDRQHWDHNYRAVGELGRLLLGVVLIGEDGFADTWDTLNGPDRTIVPGKYGGIAAAQDCNCDYVAFALEMIQDGPDDVDDAMAIARDPYVAAAAVRAWYDRQYGVAGNMVMRNDHWQHQFRKHESRVGRDE